MKGILLFIFLFCFSSEVLSQGTLTVRNNESIGFLLFINDEQVNLIPCVSITLNDLQATRISLKAELPSLTNREITQQITLKNNSSVFYDLELVRDGYRFVLKSESKISRTAKPSGIALPDGGESIGEDAFEESEHSVKRNGDCNNPISESQFERFVSEIKNVDFENKRIQMMTEFIEIHCIKSGQLNTMLSLLAMEEYKLQLVHSSITRIYDPSNLMGIENNFFLERNKSAVIQLISSLKAR